MSTIVVALIAVIIQAVALVVNAGVAIYNSIKQSRPYVRIWPDYIDERSNTPTQLTAKLAMANVGKTPAFKVEGRGIIKVASYPLKKEEEWPDLSDKKWQVPLTVFPEPNSGFEMPVFSDGNIVQPGAQQRLYIFAEIKYQGFFWFGKRTTQCCAAVTWQQNGKPIFHVEGSHNEVK